VAAAAAGSLTSSVKDISGSNIEQVMNIPQLVVHSLVENFAAGVADFI